MIKQISLIAIVAIGIGTLFLGTPAFAALPPGCTGDPHIGDTRGDPHAGSFNPDSGNPHVSFGTCNGRP